MSDKLSDDAVALVKPKQPTRPTVLSTVATYQQNLISKRNSFLYVIVIVCNGNSFCTCNKINLKVMRKTYSKTEFKIKYKFITLGAIKVI